MEKNPENIAGISDRAFDGFPADRLQPMEPIPTGMAPGGRLGRPLECILFDVYGTLFISATGDIRIARKSALAPKEFQGLLDEFDISTPPEQVLASYFREIQEAHRKANQQGVDYPEVHIDRIWAEVLGCEDMPRVRRFALEFELLANPVWPMPHLENLLVACQKSGLPMGIISNAQFYTPLLLRWFLKADPPDFGFMENLLVYSYEAGCAKPSPRIFELAVSRLEKMGIPSGAVLYVGNDVRNDILPAKRAGFQTALFAGDARSLRLGGEDSKGNGAQADLIITDLRQLLPHITGNSEH